MKVIIFTNVIRQVSGVRTFEKNIIKSLVYDGLDVYYSSTIIESGVDLELPNGARYISVNDSNLKDHKFDVCILSSIDNGIALDTIKADRYIQVIHTCVIQFNINYKNIDRVKEYVAVGYDCARTFHKKYGIMPHVIPNILNTSIPNVRLKLITASRVSIGKGFERMLILATKLKQSGIDFEWDIFGDGGKSYYSFIKGSFSPYPEVSFKGVVDDVRPFMRNADYLVQLSDVEGYCYAMFEALQMGIKCIVTPFDEAKKNINEHNGIILDYDLENVDINIIVDKIRPKQFFYKNNAAKLWIKYIKNGHKSKS